MAQGGRPVRWLFGPLSLILVFSFVEAVARVGFTLRDDFRSEGLGRTGWHVYSPELMWDLAPGFAGVDEAGLRREFDASGFLSVDTDQLSGSSRRKILFLGDSNTYGYGVATEDTFVELLDGRMPEASAVNLGVPGYTSYQGYRILLQRGLAIEPEVVVVSFNFNDRRYVLDGESVDGAEAFERRYRKLTGPARWVEKLRLYHAIRMVLEKLGVAPQGPVFSGPKPVDALLPRVGPADYRHNLEQIAERAREAGAEVVFLMLGDDPVRSAYLRKGIDQLERMETAAAIESLEVAVRLDNFFSDLARIHLVRAYEKQGLPDEARKARTTQTFSSLHGARPLYLDREYHEIMREVAESHAVPVVDARAALAASPADFLDFCHPDEDGHRVIAELLHEHFGASE